MQVTKCLVKFPSPLGEKAEIMPPIYIEPSTVIALQPNKGNTVIFTNITGPQGATAFLVAQPVEKVAERLGFEIVDAASPEIFKHAS